MDNRELIIFANKNEPPLASLVTSQLVTDVSVNINWCSETYILVDDNKLNTDASVCRFIARSSTTQHLYGSSVLDSVEVDQWISFAIGELQYGSFLEELKYLDKELYTKTYLVGHSITIADILLWSVLYRDSRWKGMSEEKSKYMNVNRWYSFIESQQSIQKVLKVESGVKNSANREINEKQVSKLKRKAEGKFIQLPGAEQGKVVVRFPPEASGYLHIGHAKAVLLNQYYRDTYEGKLIMRFDDTNPAKEKVDFEKVILEDLRLLKVNWDIFSHTSDYFDSMLEYCEQLLKSEDAYVDDTDAESMKQEREQKIESKNRNNTVETNLLMWQEMKMGTEKGQRCCVRAKIDMNSANGCLRDPTIYRCKNEPHPRTNTKYKVYPTYDFACPIVDSLEGVTHCLRTTEYHDRDEQFIWFIKKLGLREPVIWDYSRLNMTHTVLSKRKLTWFIEEGLVDGWDDPRLPTVRGIIRRGLTVDGLKEFIIAQGGSRSVVVMHWDKIWAINKKIIDPITPRYTAVDEFHVVRVNVKNANEQLDKVKLHPKNDDLGEKTVYRASSIIIEQADAQFVKEGQTVTFVSWGNMKIVKIERKGKIVISVDAELCLSDTNYKDTMKVTWLANNVSCYPLIPVICVYFDHIITKAVLGKDEDFKNYVNKNTKSEALMLGEPELRNVKQGDIIQLLRKGFFICDKSYESYSIHSCCQSPIILFYIPDGHTKEVYPANIAKAENVNAVTEISGKSELNLNTEKVSMAETSGSGSVDKVSVLLADITAQGDKVRSLKAAKAEKALITDEVQQLLALKSKYKLLTGEEWTPNIVIKNLADGAATEKITPSKNEKVTVVLNAIVTQGNHVRSLKAAKAEKSVLTEEVQKLLALKSEYKILTGEEWKPDINIESSKESSQSVDLITEQSSDKTAFLSNAIATQGNHVRSLKAAKADKSVITEQVQKLLALKSKYKTLTGEEWKPGIHIESSKESSQSVDRVTEQSSDKTAALSNAIATQGNHVRSLKAAKADKSVITEEVQKLLALKNEYKTLTGEEWKPGIHIESSKESSQSVDRVTEQSSDKTAALSNAIATQGNHVRSLKAAKADKSVITEEVQKLLALKNEYKTLTGEEWKPDINIESSKESSQSVVRVTEQSSDKTASLSNAIATQGNRVRSLKAAKADKSVITEEVQKLLALKSEYKTLTGEEWKPDINIESSKESSQSVVRVTEQSSDKTASLSNAIATQGNRVRSLKAAKADKSVITEEVQKLLALKSEYKTLTGEEWKPEHSLRQQQPIGKCSITSNEGDEQPNTTSNSKINDADAIGGGVQKSTVLKTEYAKSAVESKIQKSSVKGEKCVKNKIKEIENIPNIREVSSTANSSALSERYSPDVARVLDDIQFQCVVLSTLRQSREQTSNELVYEETKKLFALKDKFKELTGHMWTPDYEDLTELLQSSDIRPTTSASTVSVNIPDKNGPAREKKTVTSQQSTIPSVKKQTRLGLEVKKEDNLPEWYSQVITKSELIEYYDVSGCYILRPWAYAIWETIQSWFDTEIKKLGVQNCYFPIFVSKGALEREKTHIADFAPEVAWVTKSGDSDLAEPIAIRPTSETVMYPAYAKWIQSYRDLPIKLNQWNNVVRWEFKHPQPFLRTREFLWQEGHTAFATMKEAVDEVYTILDLYAKIYTDLLAIPVVKGRKTEKEKFAGGDFTTTVEAFVAISGRGIQGGTSHHLGQNFSKMFNIIFEDPETKEKAFVYQNSWGITTRTIGVMIMIHADNQGLVLPPRLAAIQVIIVPCGIGVNTTEDESNMIYTSCRDLERDLKSVDIRVKGDYRDNYSPGWKFNHWELKGVPIRIELGPKDIKEERFVIVRRDTGQKISISRQQAIDRVKSILENIHEFLYRKAEKDLQSHIITCHSWSQFTPALDKKNLILAPFCCETSCEDNIKRDSARDEGLEPGAPSMGAKSLCIPFEQPIDGLQDDQKCIHHGCTNVARCYVLFGRSY